MISNDTTRLLRELKTRTEAAIRQAQVPGTFDDRIMAEDFANGLQEIRSIGKRITIAFVGDRTDE